MNQSKNAEESTDELLQAATEGRYDDVKRLIDAGADLETKDTANQSALHLAARFGHKNVVEYLLTAGMDPDAVDKGGNTAAQLTNNVDILNTLAQASLQANEQKFRTALEARFPPLESKSDSDSYSEYDFLKELGEGINEDE